MKNEIPCPHFNIEIVTRAKGRSAVAAAAYQSGEKLYSAYDGQWKSGNHQERIVFKDILLPPNAPPSYADRQTLWNGVDASESRENAQTARRFIITLPKELSIEDNIRLIRNYCQTQFVDKGMIADIAVHFDGKDPPNPHAHILCTMRSMGEHGQWNEKTKTTYALDENGNRIMGKNGKWKRIRVDTVDWNDRKYCEIWRHEWEVMQNAALEQVGRAERVNMKSFKRQGLETAPQVHLGPAAFALERKGVQTELGDHNRAVKTINALLTAIKNKLKALREWLTELSAIISDHEKLESPSDYPLAKVLLAYYDLRKKERRDWSTHAKNTAGTKDLKALSQAIIYLREHDVDTVNDLARLLNDTVMKINGMHSEKRAKERRIRDIDAIFQADTTIRELGPILEKYNSIFFKTAKEKYGREHADEIEQVKNAQSLLHKLQITQPINKKALKAESVRLRGETETMLPDLKRIEAELKQLKTFRFYVRKIMPDALKKSSGDNRQSFADISEQAENEKGLQQLLDRSADQAIQRSNNFEEQNPMFIQQQVKEQQKNLQKGGR